MLAALSRVCCQRRSCVRLASPPASRSRNPTAGHRPRIACSRRDRPEGTRPTGARTKNIRAEGGGAADVVKIAETNRDRHGAVARIGRDGGESARLDAAGCAADRFGAGPPGDDREGEVSRVGSDVGLGRLQNTSRGKGIKELLKTAFELAFNDFNVEY
jgi:hypothetical protein